MQSISAVWVTIIIMICRTKERTQLIKWGRPFNFLPLPTLHVVLLSHPLIVLPLLGMPTYQSRTLLGLAGTKLYMYWFLSTITPKFSFRTYQLKRGVVGANATATSGGSEQPLLPLWGQLCCNLMAQPECATSSRMSGFINIQVSYHNTVL